MPSSPERPAAPGPPPPRSSLLKKLLFAALPLLLACLAVELGFRVAGVGRPDPLLPSTPRNEYASESLAAPDGRVSTYDSGIHVGAAVRLNEHGFRDWLYHETKPAGTVRIAALGDSYTFGQGVPETETWPRRMEALVRSRVGDGRDLIVQNFGRCGSNTANEAGTLRNHVLRHSPDLVVLGFTLFNDAETRKELNRAVARSAKEADSTVVRVGRWLKDHSWFVNFAMNRLRRGKKAAALHAHVRKQYAEDAPGWLECREALAEIAGTCRENEVPLIVVIFPVHQDDDALNDWANYREGDVHRRIEQVLAPFPEVEVIDPVTSLEALDGRRIWLGRDRHPNALWHRHMAELIAPAAAQRLGLE